LQQAFCGRSSTNRETENNAREYNISRRELQAVLADIGDVQDISLSALSKAIKSKLLSGKRYSRKKITHLAKERFTYETMVYTQLFINYLSSKDPAKVKFFNEAGIKDLIVVLAFTVIHPWVNVA